MALTPGQLLSHYRIVEQIGAGGMGVVYRAEDTKLRRHIALKVLPPELVGDPDRRSRFLREARTAAAVTHPNITTIHEIDEAEGTVFIAMELVEGESLRRLIGGRPLEIKVALRLAIEMAEGLAEAHKAHIIHRDLKPDNVIVTTAGHVKLLDFGLAKLLREGGEGTEGEPSKLSTVTVEATLEGRMLGTPAYMSPEQIRGEAVDARTDGFSFGATLYEMVTGRLPFQAGTLGGILAAVLGTEPVPASQLNEAVPAELERIIRKCLQKEREARYQDTRDLLVDLRELQEGRSSLQVTRPDAATRAKAEAGAGRRSPARLAAWAAAAAVGIIAIALGAYRWRAGSGAVPAVSDPFQSMRMSSVTGASDILRVVLSPDARYLAIVRGMTGQGRYQTRGNSTIMMRQLATGSEVQIHEQDRIGAVTFSPDGEHLYYYAAIPETVLVGLYQIPSLGGTGRKLLQDLDSGVGVSPDGSRLAFVREVQVPARKESNLVAYDLASATETILATVDNPQKLGYDARPAWSPDGLRVAAVVFTPERGGRSKVMTFHADGTGREQVGDEWTDPQIDSLAWRDGHGLLLSGRDAAGGVNQIWHLSWPDGRRHRITNDLNDYRDLSVSADGTTVAALRVSRTSNLWSVSAGGDLEPRQLTFGSAGADVIDAIIPTGDGSVGFTAGDEAGLALWTMRSDGTARRKISAEAQLASFDLRPLGRQPAVVFTGLAADLAPHVWRMDLDGGNAAQLTRGGGEILKAVSPDGRRLLYIRNESPNELWDAPVSGGEPRKIVDDAMLESHFAGGTGRKVAPEYSPDGTLLRIPRLHSSAAKMHVDWIIVPASGGEPIGVFHRPPETTLVRWTPDGVSLTYDTVDGGVSRLMRWPISGGDPAVLLSFREAELDWFAWSPGGRDLVFRARNPRGSNLWLWSPDDPAPPRQLTDFTAGEIFDFAWSADDRSVYFTQGIASRDVVVLRESRER